MNIKRLIVRTSLLSLLAVSVFPQTDPQKPLGASQTAVATRTAAEPAAKPAAERKEVPVFSYDPGGRRDPFKDLMGGKEVKGKRAITGLADLEISEVTLLGIVESKSGFEAIVSLPEGFPLTVREGDKLADGFVLSIRADAVVCRKTHDNGVPLSRPRDVVKEIQPEERTHD